mmetsp:Transcript_566/g.2011  ORF Transcript_566/g.2011 Transcript_566/m.2011 type:complete len:282 (-) Transcript_566:1384-2229(-)
MPRLFVIEDCVKLLPRVFRVRPRIGDVAVPGRAERRQVARAAADQRPLTLFGGAAQLAQVLLRAVKVVAHAHVPRRLDRYLTVVQRLQGDKLRLELQPRDVEFGGVLLRGSRRVALGFGELVQRRRDLLRGGAPDVVELAVQGRLQLREPLARRVGRLSRAQFGGGHGLLQREEGGPVREHKVVPLRRGGGRLGARVVVVVFVFVACPRVAEPQLARRGGVREGVLGRDSERVRVETKAPRGAQHHDAAVRPSEATWAPRSGYIQVRARPEADRAPALVRG